MNPKMKFIFIMRNPLDRCWSHFKNHLRKRPTTDTIKRAESFFVAPGCISRSSYIETIEKLEAHFPRDQIHYCFFDDIENDESRLIKAIFRFLEVPEIAVNLTPPLNGASMRTKMPPSFARQVAPLLLEPTQKLAERFGGYTEDWADTISSCL
jgi:hypothetical protein